MSDDGDETDGTEAQVDGETLIVSDARGMIEDLDRDLAQLAREEAERTYEGLQGQASD